VGGITPMAEGGYRNTLLGSHGELWELASLQDGKWGSIPHSPHRGGVSSN